MKLQKKLINSLLQFFARIQTFHLSQYLLLTFGLSVCVMGMLFLLAPQYHASLFGFATLSPNALIDVRAFYGMMSVSIGLLTLYSVLGPLGSTVGFWLIIVFAGGSGVGRLIGMSIDGLSVLHSLLAMVELAISVVAIVFLKQAGVTAITTSANPERPEDFDPLSPENLQNPYPFYRALRHYAPVYQIPGTDWYNISRYEDIKQLALNTEDISSNLVAILLNNEGRTAMLNKPDIEHGPVDVLAIQDPPRHTTQRKLGLQMMSMRFVQSLEDEVREMAIEIMSRFMERGEADWVKEFAKEIPMRISLKLVGFPNDNWRKIKEWCDHGIALLSGVNTPEDFAVHTEAATSIFSYINKQWHIAKTKPEQDNFTGALLKAVADPDVDLTEDEAISMIFQIIIAGSDSSANTIGNTVKVLAERPDLQCQLRRDPTLIEPYIEEILRLESPFQGHFRKTTTDMTVAGTTLPAGSRLMLLWASGNRDESVFEHADKIDLNRVGLKKILSFGLGKHQCLGAHLARLEIKVALQELLARTEMFVLDHERYQQVQHLNSVFVRELTSLPIRFVASKPEEHVTGYSTEHKKTHSGMFPQFI